MFPFSVCRLKTCIDDVERPPPVDVFFPAILRRAAPKVRKPHRMCADSHDKRSVVVVP